MTDGTDATSAGDDQRLVERLVSELVSANGDTDESTFLGAQFDAGLAWVHNPVGTGGLALAPNLQDIIDSTLQRAGRLSSWLRNPMGIGMVGPALAVHGTETQRRHLRSIFTAENIWCQLFSEPGAGSDVATLATRAVRDGGDWVVDGQKVWTSLADQARFGLLLARTDPDVPKHNGMTAFILDMHAAGIEVRPLRQMNGGAEFCEVYLTDARVPDSARVGGVGEGWGVAVTTLMNERISIGGVVEARGSGPIAAALDVWTSEPRVDQARRDELLALWVEAEVLRLGNMRAQQLRDSGTPGPEGSVLKLGGALLSRRIHSFAVSLRGAAGMLGAGYDGAAPEGDLVDAFLFSQSTTIAGGTTEIMRNIIGERVLGLPGEPRADRGIPWNQIPKGGARA